MSSDQRPEPAWSGEDDLARLSSTHLGERYPVAAVAAVAPGRLAIAHRGCADSADFEIGSLSKGVTGLLYADAISRGEVTSDTTLGEAMPSAAGLPIAPITLGSLAVHRSGLPSLPMAMKPYRRTWRWWRHGTNPYGDSLAEVLEHCRTVVIGKPKPLYSNLGFQLLGHAVASAAGTDYQTLLRDRISEPLSLPTWFAPSTESELRSESLRGVSKSGKPRAPWVGEGLAPAGGIRADVLSVAMLLRALADGSAPGISALDPVADFQREGTRIGAAWITSAKPKQNEVTWHNGMTGGFASWLGVDRAAGTGVAVLVATGRPVDAAGDQLLSDWNAAVRAR